MASDLRGYSADEVLNKVLNTSNDSIQVDIVAGAEYAEDSGHSSTDTGNFVLGVRNDTLAALGGTDGDYVPFQMNASGALFVEVASASGDDSIYVDDADWTNSSSKHTLVGGLYQSSPQSITDGDTGPLQVNANGNLIVDLSATDNAVLDAMAASLALLDNSIASGNELQVDVVGSLPAGSAAIGKLAANSGVDIGDVDVASTVQPAGHGAVAQFTTNIAGSATQLDAHACKHADVMGKIANVGIVYVGGSSVAATTGIALYPGDVYSVDVTNTNLLYGIAVNANDDLQVVYYN